MLPAIDPRRTSQIRAIKGEAAARGAMAPAAPAPGQYLGRYPKPPGMAMSPAGGQGAPAMGLPAAMPHFAQGGGVGQQQYYATGGEVDVNAQHPMMPATPSMEGTTVPGYAMGGSVGPMDMEQRSALPSSDFAMPSMAPGPGSYPMPDRAHAANAKARASQFGSPKVKSAVNAKAKAKFGMSKGGSVSTKTGGVIKPMPTDPQTASGKTPAGPKAKVPSKPSRVSRVKAFEAEHGESEV